MTDKLDIYFEDEKIDIENKSNEQEDKREENKFKELSKADREIAVYRGLVPKSLMDSTFDVKMIKSNLYETHRASNKTSSEISKLAELGIKTLSNSESKKIINFDSYAELCNSILSNLYFGKIPNRSYIIGAPDGTGKTSMVMEAIMVMSSRGMKVAPYKTLWELAMIKSDNEINSCKNIYISSKQVDYLEYKKAIDTIKMALNDAIIEKDLDKVKFYQDALNYNINNVGEIRSISEEIYKSSAYNRIIGNAGNEVEYNRTRYTGAYNFQEYLDADCLFCNLSSFSSREIETNTLDFILRSREIKGLPTIVTTKESIDGYIKDRNIGNTWQNLITDNRNNSQYGKLYHVSTYIISQKQV